MKSDGKKKDGIVQINDVIDATKEKDSVFNEFISRHFILSKEGLNKQTINNNIDTLKKMDNTQQSIVKARTASLEESFDVAKYFPPLVAIFTLVLGMFAIIRDLKKDSPIVAAASLFAVIGVVIFLSRIYFNQLEKRITAVYFRKLLDNLNYKK